MRNDKRLEKMEGARKEKEEEENTGLMLMARAVRGCLLGGGQNYPDYARHFMPCYSVSLVL